MAADELWRHIMIIGRWWSIGIASSSSVVTLKDKSKDQNKDLIFKKMKLSSHAFLRYAALFPVPSLYSV